MLILLLTIISPPVFVAAKTGAAAIGKSRKRKTSAPAAVVAIFNIEALVAVGVVAVVVVVKS